MTARRAGLPLLLTCLILWASPTWCASAAMVPEWPFPAALVGESVGLRKTDPLAFAAAVPLHLDQSAGAWDQSAPGQARWRLAFQSPGARSLSLLLDTTRLPQDAKLYWRAEPGGDRQGPFRGPWGPRVWLPLVRGERAVLEVLVPQPAQQLLQLRVLQGFHGFRGPGLAPSSSKGTFGRSGSCNLNAACVEGDGWRREIRATVLITVGNSALCSGTLLNNSRHDGRPLVLTARHCVSESTAIDSVRAYFNLEQSCCSNAPPPRADQFLHARALLLTDDATDLALLELERSPPQNFHAYFSGWDARPDATPQSGASVHHPQGDDKRISFFNTPARRLDAQPVGGFAADVWEVQWAQGTTEPGSSGAALWNEDRRVVGQLAGGAASCANSSGKDYFGRLERAWTRQPALKTILAPDSEILALEGMDSGAPQVPSCPSPGAAPRTAAGGGGGGALVSPLWAVLLAVLARLARVAAPFP